MSKQHPFNGMFLMLARHIRGIELDELAEITELDRDLLLRYESGVRYPPQDHVQLLVETLEFPASFYYRPGRSYPTLETNIQWYPGS